MHILCVGLSHHSAPLSLMESLYLGTERRRDFLARYGKERHAGQGRCTELAVLSTCNRVELYALMGRTDYRLLENLLSEESGVPRHRFSNELFRIAETDAARHLFQVSAGLDSLVLGEPQILGQVAKAFQDALDAGAIGPVLSRLFQAALHVGKRARHETTISASPASIGSVGVQLAASAVKDLSRAHVLVVGAGEMAELAVGALCKRGVKRITVINRTLSRAESLAERWGARARPLGALADEIASADVLITSTAAPRAVIRRELISPVMRLRPTRPLVMLDIAMPRNVEPEVGYIPGVHLYDIQYLSRRLTGTLYERRQEIPKVNRLIEEELEAFQAWFSILPVRPVIAAMYQKAEAIREHELERTLRRLSHLKEEDRTHIRALTRAIVKKLLHSPTERLKGRSEDGESGQYAALLGELFELEAPETDSRDLRIDLP